MPFRYIAVVDEYDRPIGLRPKEDVWERGLLHRVVMILAEDTQGRVLLQKRAPQVNLFPGAWDYSAAGHVDAGETYEAAARRETEEEIGLRDASFKALASWRSHDTFKGRILNRFNRLYRIRLDAAKFDLQKSEVSEVRWFTLAEIQNLIETHPERLTPGLIGVIKKHYLNPA